ncbi:MAG: rhomboid family intramembrane serine protease [Deltaproteobacteria bacterium]|nr:rhomboid family intramembrane serine protease [Deltaproteobacteria bacterium]
MIPIRNTIQPKNYPVSNSLIISANILIYILMIYQGERVDRLYFIYGIVPARYSMPEVASYFTLGQQILSLFSFQFIHGGFWHLLSNMWSLYIFGGNLEDRIGSVRYLMFYILCGCASGISHLVLNWHSTVPTIGASGAIAGVMGAYLILYPRSKILTLIPVFIIPYFVELPAALFLGIWFLIQFISATGTHLHEGGIAWWAHIGGFISGMIFLQFFLKMPETGLTSMIRSKTSKRKTPHFQMIRVSSQTDGPHLYGDIEITPREAEFGTRKLINVPWGFGKRLFRVTIPAGVRQGTLLRLGGLGNKVSNEERGDIYLKVSIP